MFMTRAILARPDGQDCRGSAELGQQHRMIWSLFTDGAEGRDFLWRETRPDQFLILSVRPPRRRREFALDTQPWRLSSEEGARLEFSLRVNATRSARQGGRGRRIDIVFEEMTRHPTAGTLPERRLAAARTAAPEWFASRGPASGYFVADPAQDVAVRRYQVMRSRRRSGRPAIFGVLDLEGELLVTDPGRLASTVATGIGRARAFGCGLVLLGHVAAPGGPHRMRGREIGLFAGGAAA